MTLPPDPEEATLQEKADEVAGDQPREHVPAGHGDEQAEQETSGDDGLGESSEKKLFPAPGGPVERECIERTDGGKGEEEKLQLEGEARESGVNQEQGNGGGCHEQAT